MWPEDSEKNSARMNNEEFSGKGFICRGVLRHQMGAKKGECRIDLLKGPYGKRVGWAFPDRDP